MLRSVTASGALCTLTVTAWAQPVPEVEPNNAVPGPAIFPAGLPFYAVRGSIAPGDFDAFDHGPLVQFPNIIPLAGGYITVGTWTDPMGSGDTLLGEWFAGIIPPLFAIDDDSNPGRNSAMQFNHPYGPTLTHIVSGTGDTTFVGHHNVTTDYCLVAAAWGAPEAEPNDTAPAANVFPPLQLGATAVEGFLGPATPIGNDVDMFTHVLPAGTYVTAAAYDFSAPPPTGWPPVDLLLGVADPAGFTYVDDNEGPGNLPALSFYTVATGPHTFMVTGTGDLSFSGFHTQFGPYRLVVADCQRCDKIDFNKDGLFPDTLDIDDFLTVFSGGTCSTGGCNDIDFNNDGLFPDTLDIDALLSVFSGGPCL